MSLIRIKFVVILILLAGSVFVVLSQKKSHVTSSSFTPMIPRVWDDAEMAQLQLPLIDSTASPKQISSDYYYRIPVRTIYKNYPVYGPGKEPAGYLDWLKQQAPESAFDAGALKTEADWIRAGELVFDSPVFYDNIAQIADVRNPEWYEKLGVPATKEGTLPWFRYVIREKGKVELGTLSCAMCHTRVMPDGTVVKGAQGNFPFERVAAMAASRFKPEQLHGFERSFFGAPWIKPDPLVPIQQMSPEKLVEMHAAIPPGVIARHGTNPLFPPQTPDLIGIKDRKYLDHTGLQLHRSIADMMRYAALNQGADNLASYGGFIPVRGTFARCPIQRSCYAIVMSNCMRYRSTSIRSSPCRIQISSIEQWLEVRKFSSEKDVPVVIHRPSTLTTRSYLSMALKYRENIGRRMTFFGRQ